MATGGAEEHFAKRLANNDKLVRDRAVKKLRAWISSRPEHGEGFSETDLLKIWKGLFYCMWMSDKPLVQEELTETLSRLIHSFRNVDSAILFIEVFFKTMHREWHGIDRLRLDKFYLLLRAFVNQSFQLLKRHKWDERLTEKLTEVYREGPLRPNSEATPVGITLHLAENYFLELRKTGGAQIESATVLRLLDPLLSLLAQTKNKTVARAVKDGVLEILINSGSREEELEEQELHCQVDLSALAEKLFNLARSREILGRNRNQLYEYIKKFRSITNGHVSDDKRKLENDDSETACDTEVQGAAEGQDVALEPVKKKRKKKQGRNDEEASQGENLEQELVSSEPSRTERNAAKRAMKDKVGPDQGRSEELNELEDTVKKGRKGGKRELEQNQEVGKQPEESETVEQDSMTHKTKNRKKRGDGSLGQFEESESIERDVEINEQSNRRKGGEKHQGQGGVLDDRVNETRKGKKNRSLQDQETKEESNESDEVNTEGKESKKRQKLNNGTLEECNLLPAAKSKTKKNRKGTLNSVQGNSPKNLRTEAKDNRSTKELKQSQNLGDSRTLINEPNLDLENGNCTVELSTEKIETKKFRRKSAQSREEPFAKFLKTNSTPPAFVRKAVAKVQPRTEPRKTAQAKPRPPTPGSAPAVAARKRVTIELEKNTAQSPQEYRKSVKDSPDIPYSADKTPSHGLLRTPLVTPVTTKEQLGKGRRKTPGRRAKAADFF